MSRDPIDQMAVGRKAQLALEYLDELLGEQEKNSLTVLVSNFRSGKVEQKDFLPMISQLSVLDNLRRDLIRKVDRGNKVAMEVTDA